MNGSFLVRAVAKNIVQSMKVLVTGGSGFVGAEICHRLVAAGYLPRLVVRNRRKHRLLPDSNVEYVQGNVLDISSLTHACAGVDAVIHLVGIISEMGENTFERIHVAGTENVMQAATAAGVKRFIHMSALGTRTDARSRYHQSKWKGETIVRESPLPFTVFRPSLIYGRHDHFVNLFAKISKFSPIVPLMGRPSAEFQPVGVEQVSAAFVKALEEPRAVGQTFDLAGPERFTMREMIGCILEVTRRRRLLLQVPRALAQMQARVLEWFFPLVLRKAPPLNGDQLLMLEEDNTGAPAEADEIFSLRHPAFRQGISRYL